MNFDLPDELLGLRDSVRRLAHDKVKPRARPIDTEGAYPDDLFAAFRDAGLLGLCIPVEYGGSGAGILGLALAIEEVAKYSNTAALMLLLTRLPTGPVMIAGTEEQKGRYLPGICDGTQRAAFGLSEPQAGSDVMGIRTRGVPASGPDGGWVLNGTKCWMSGVREADWYTVFAKTSDPASRAPRLGHGVHRRAGLGRGGRRAHRPQDGRAWGRHRRARADGRPRAGGERDRRGRRLSTGHARA